jgi:glycosyltransferase involved in cell wall biosynthesis
MRASIIIRTLDEARHLPALLAAIEAQDAGDLDVEVVVVDSGSRDRTVEIAMQHGCRIERIQRSEFSFGRSLNIGCAAASGELLLFVSGHCVPRSGDWLRNLVGPILEERVVYTYGRQVGGEENHFSECRVFEKQYPSESRIPQSTFFCNNANAALRRDFWEKYGFDTDVTGLEDMELAKRLQRYGHDIGYVAEACVVHHHDESWQEIRWRFEREALALRVIMPEVQLQVADAIRYGLSAVLHDVATALGEGSLLRHGWEIVRYRVAQYWGSLRGGREHRRLSRRQKEQYFYPKQARS